MNCTPERRQFRFWKLAPWSAFGAVALLACAAKRGVSNDALAAAQKRSPQGAELYQEICAECHGPRGEGGPGTPRIMGPSALPIRVEEKVDRQRMAEDEIARERARRSNIGGPKELRMRFKTAADIQRFMVEKHPALHVELTDEDYWPVLSYILDAHGVSIPAGGLTAKNAGSVPNSPK
jgi:hypothetical protein